MRFWPTLLARCASSASARASAIASSSRCRPTICSGAASVSVTRAMHPPRPRSSGGQTSAADVDRSVRSSFEKFGGAQISPEPRVPMKSSLFTRIVLAIILAGSLGAASAEDAAKNAAPPSPAERRAPERGVLRLLPADSVTEHSISTARGPLAYTATAGTLPFYDQSGEQTASVFYTAYVVKDGRPNRPLTFVFNGGPGAASAFLHLGLVGPRILDFGPDSHDAARATLRDNPETWLSFTDLVLIDPIGTGWSRTVKPDDGKNFWSIRSDASAMA